MEKMFFSWMPYKKRRPRRKFLGNEVTQIEKTAAFGGHAEPPARGVCAGAGDGTQLCRDGASDAGDVPPGAACGLPRADAHGLGGGELPQPPAVADRTREQARTAFAGAFSKGEKDAPAGGLRGGHAEYGTHRAGASAARADAGGAVYGGMHSAGRRDGSELCLFRCLQQSAAAASGTKRQEGNHYEAAGAIL